MMNIPITTTEREIFFDILFERCSQALCLTDADNVIVRVNSAYEKLSGFSSADAVGRTPAIQKSGRHDQDFYRAMWREILENNCWEGEIWDRRADGTVYPKWLTIDRLVDDSGVVQGHVAMFHELSSKKALEDEVERLVNYDQLTNLPNKFLFHHRLIHEIAVAMRSKGRMGVLFINLDRFKNINDSYGYVFGDSLLVAVGQRIEEQIRKVDLVTRMETGCERKPDCLSRFGGDEFSLILAALGRSEDAALVARRIEEALQKPFVVEGRTVFVGVSMGIALFPDNAMEQSSLIQCAERAMQRVKEHGGGGIEFYADAMNRHCRQILILETRMRTAFQQEAFVLHYQPKVDLSTMTVVGMEALIRWPMADGGTTSPMAFIPLAEETGLIIPLGEWILRMACRDTITMNKAMGMRLTVAVNVSVRQFRDGNFPDVVAGILAATGLDPGLLELEITESIVMEETEKVMATLQSLKDLGLRLAIDDFGTGYSSLGALKHFPVDVLKVDRSFVLDLTDNPGDATIVATVCSMGHEMGLSVVAEGIERQEHLTFLKGHRCHLGQGYYLGRPMAREDFVDWCKENAVSGRLQQ